MFAGLRWNKLLKPNSIWINYQFSSQWAVTNCCLIIYLTNKLYVLCYQMHSPALHHISGSQLSCPIKVTITIELSNQQAVSCNFVVADNCREMWEELTEQTCILQSVHLLRVAGWKLKNMHYWKKSRKERWEVVCSNIL